jgi:hypothetical protein
MFINLPNLSTDPAASSYNAFVNSEYVHSIEEQQRLCAGTKKHETLPVEDDNTPEYLTPTFKTT